MNFYNEDWQVLRGNYLNEEGCPPYLFVNTRMQRLIACTLVKR